MSETQASAREDLEAWRALQPTNVYESNRLLNRLLDHHLGDARHAAHREHLMTFGEKVMTKLDPAAIVGNRPWNLPRLERWSPIGERIEAIEHHPTHAVCGEAIYQDGRVIAVYEEPAANTLAQAVFYLSSHTGEAGHNCPVACTAGVVKALSAAGSAEMRCSPDMCATSMTKMQPERASSKNAAIVAHPATSTMSPSSSERSSTRCRSNPRRRRP